MKAGTPSHATQRACHAPMATPQASTISTVGQKEKSYPALIIAASTPAKDTVAPIDRSM